MCYFNSNLDHPTKKQQNSNSEIKDLPRELTV